MCVPLDVFWTNCAVPKDDWPRQPPPSTDKSLNQFQLVFELTCLRILNFAIGVIHSSEDTGYLRQLEAKFAVSLAEFTVTIEREKADKETVARELMGPFVGLLIRKFSHDGLRASIKMHLDKSGLRCPETDSGFLGLKETSLPTPKPQTKTPSVFNALSCVSSGINRESFQHGKSADVGRKRKTGDDDTRPGRQNGSSKWTHGSQEDLA